MAIPQDSKTTWTDDSALLVIDVQRGVVADGWDRDGVVNRIAGLIGHARDIDVPVIYIQHEVEAYPPMARGGEGWQICDARRSGNQQPGALRRAVGCLRAGDNLSRDRRWLWRHARQRLSHDERTRV